MEMKRKIKVFIEWLELFALSFGSIFFYVYILACIWLLKRARNYSGLFLHLDKCHEKVYIWRYKQDLTVYAISLCFYKKCSMRSNYERVRLCYVPSVRQNTGHKVPKSPQIFRQFRTTSNLEIGSKSVWNFENFWTEKSTRKTHPRGVQKYSEFFDR